MVQLKHKTWLVCQDYVCQSCAVALEVKLIKNCPRLLQFSHGGKRLGDFEDYEKFKDLSVSLVSDKLLCVI